jgi:hypothetical protein
MTRFSSYTSILGDIRLEIAKINKFRVQGGRERERGREGKGERGRVREREGERRGEGGGSGWHELSPLGKQPPEIPVPGTEP